MRTFSSLQILATGSDGNGAPNPKNHHNTQTELVASFKVNKDNYKNRDTKILENILEVLGILKTKIDSEITNPTIETPRLIDSDDKFAGIFDILKKEGIILNYQWNREIIARDYFEVSLPSMEKFYKQYNLLKNILLEIKEERKTNFQKCDEKVSKALKNFEESDMMKSLKRLYPQTLINDLTKFFR